VAVRRAAATNGGRSATALFLGSLSARTGPDGLEKNTKTFSPVLYQFKTAVVN
jgi:hypothetical protein